MDTLGSHQGIMIPMVFSHVKYISRRVLSPLIPSPSQILLSIYVTIWPHKFRCTPHSQYPPHESSSLFSKPLCCTPNFACAHPHFHHHRRFQISIDPVFIYDSGSPNRHHPVHIRHLLPIRCPPLFSVQVSPF